MESKLSVTIMYANPWIPISLHLVMILVVVYFNQKTHACAWVRMVEINWKHWKMMKKVPFPSYTREAHKRLTKKNEEKSLLVSDWEWLPKAGWHPKAGCSFGIFFKTFSFLFLFFKFLIFGLRIIPCKIYLRKSLLT